MDELAVTAALYGFLLLYYLIYYGINTYILENEIMIFKPLNRKWYIVFSVLVLLGQFWVEKNFTLFVTMTVSDEMLSIFIILSMLGLLMFVSVYLGCRRLADIGAFHPLWFLSYITVLIFTKLYFPEVNYILQQLKYMLFLMPRLSDKYV